jgi:hypothetical protein
VIAEPIAAWQCIGCGRIEAPQNCVGVCQDRRVEFVHASDYADAYAALHAARDALAAARAERDAANAKLRKALSERDALEALARRLAFSRPREGEWERSYRALQGQARVALHAAQSAAAAVAANESDAAA